MVEKSGSPLWMTLHNMNRQEYCTKIRHKFLLSRCHRGPTGFFHGTLVEGKPKMTLVEKSFGAQLYF